MHLYMIYEPYSCTNDRNFDIKNKYYKIDVFFTCHADLCIIVILYKYKLYLIRQNHSIL